MPRQAIAPGRLDAHTERQIEQIMQRRAAQTLQVRRSSPGAFEAALNGDNVPLLRATLFARLEQGLDRHGTAPTGARRR